MDLEEKNKTLLKLKNCRIRFVCNEGSYEGTVCSTNPILGNDVHLFIEKIVFLKCGGKFQCLAFYGSDIKSFEILERFDPEPTPESSKPAYCDDPNRFDNGGREFTIFEQDDDDEISDCESERMDEMYNDLDDKLYKVKVPSFLADSLTTDYIVIDDTQRDFALAIKYISGLDCIGLALESPKVERNEDLHWLCISTPACTFFFDVNRLSANGFTCGLKAILENPDIEKVIHDCRLVSDCLYHNFSTRLVNVFDTQVADYIICRQRRKLDPKRLDNRVASLDVLLSDYLNIPEEFLNCRKNLSYHTDVVFYGFRPLSDDFKDLFIRNVLYLRLLKQKLDELLLEPLNKCVDVYLTDFRDKNHHEFELVSDEISYMIPEVLISSNLQIFRFKEEVPMPAVVSSGPPYRPIANPFKNFANYCKEIQKGIPDYVVEVPKEVVKPYFKPNPPFNPDEFYCKKKVCDMSCVKFVNGFLYTCRKRAPNSLSSDIPDSSNSESNGNSGQDSSENCWDILRAEYCKFQEPSSNIPKTRFRPG